MWERGARHNPLSLRNRFYMDHRPILPHDPTLDRYRRVFGNYRLVYFPFRVSKGKVKIIFSNNVPANDREAMKDLTEYHSHILNVVNKFALFPAIFVAGTLMTVVPMKWRIMFPIVFYASWKLSSAVIKSNFELRYNDIMSYFYYKYSSLAVDRLSDVNDPRRKHFRLDTTSYYRESAEDILHKQHHAGGSHGHHDSTTYYGPHPVITYLIVV